MAKRKSRSSGENTAMAAPMPSGGGSGSWDVGIRSAENGAVINVCHNSGGKNPKYESKTLVATSPRAAFRIAAAHLPALSKKAGGKKKGGKKRFAASKKV